MRKIVHLVISRFFLSGCSDYNPLSVRRNCRSKAKARAAFKKNKLPYANGLVFVNPLKAFMFVKYNGFPVVVKPNVGGFSRGAYFPIWNYSQLLRAVIGVKKWWHSSIVEAYLDGKNYRIVMTKDGVMSILQRYPPFIVGDGVHTISALIDQENKVRKQMKLFPIIQPIRKNGATIKHLKLSQLNLLSVPNNNKKINLSYKILLKLGASIEVIDKSNLSANNKQDLQQILRFFNANILGVDVICDKGVEVDFRQQKTIFLELNSRPFLQMYDYCRYGEKEDLSYFYQQLDKVELLDRAKF